MCLSRHFMEMIEVDLFLPIQLSIHTEHVMDGLSGQATSKKTKIWVNQSLVVSIFSWLLSAEAEAVKQRRNHGIEPENSDYLTFITLLD